MLTLGCSPLSRHGTASAAGGRIGRSLALMRRIGRWCYEFDGVDAFKAKFRPATWEPLYLGTMSRRLRLGDLLAVGRAEAGGAVLPFMLRALLRRRWFAARS